MTDEERLQRVTTLMARRAANVPLLGVRADRATRAAMTAACAVAAAGAAVLIAHNDPVDQTQSIPAIEQTPAAVSTPVLPVPPRAPVLREDLVDEDSGDSAKLTEVGVEITDDLDAVTGGS
jgi:hypothetical protein